MSSYELTRRIGQENASNTDKVPSSFDTRRFKQLLVIWGFSCFLAMVPTIYSFFMNPVDNLHFTVFFGDIEILYICVTLTAVVISNLAHLNPSSWVLLLNLVFVITGLVLYTSFKGGVPLPILNGPSISVFNAIFFFLVAILNVLSYGYICSKKGDPA